MPLRERLCMCMGMPVCALHRVYVWVENAAGLSGSVENQIKRGVY